RGRPTRTGPPARRSEMLPAADGYLMPLCGNVAMCYKCCVALPRTTQRSTGLHMTSNPRGPNRFYQREVARSVSGVTDTGETVERVEIDPASGKITVIVGAARDDGTESKVTNPFHTAPVHDPALKTRKKRK